MKKVYHLLTAAALLVAGVASASAERFWSYDPLKQASASTIAPGKTYALQAGHSYSAGSTIFLAGTSFSHTSYLSVANVYTFEPVEGVTGPNGEAVYNLKSQKGEYLAEMTNGTFYTMQKDRAWKLVVKDAIGIDGTKTHSRTPEPTEEVPEPQPINFTGVEAFIEEAKDAGNTDLEWKLNEVAYNPAEGSLPSGAVTISEYVSKKQDDKYAQYNFFLHYPTNNAATGGPAKATDYTRNTWCIFEAIQSDAKTSLEAVVQNLTGGRDMLEEVLRNFTRGTDSGEYSPEKYAEVEKLWKQYKSLEGGATLTNEQMDELAGALPKAYEAFVNSGVPLGAGYYIVYSLRPDSETFPNGKPYPYGPTETGYDSGALYDGAALNANDKKLYWSYKANDGVDITIDDNLKYTYEVAKFVWKVTESDQVDKNGNKLFFFQNAETNNYIGKDPARYASIAMTETPEIGYTIAASKEFPGYFNFYSPALTLTTEGGAPVPAEFSGIHAARDTKNVTAWDWRVGGSCWKVRALSEEEVKTMVAAVAQPKRNRALANVVDKAQAALDKGYSYMGVTAAGEKIESSTNGTYSIENGVDGLITQADQLDCPMFDSAEGTDIGKLIDGKLSDTESSYFHSTWHGGGEQWPGPGKHYLQVKPSEEMSALYIKWIKRLGNNNGSPAKVAIYATNSDDALAINKQEVTGEDGATTTNFEYWKKGQGWDSLGVTTFNYPYSVLKADGTEQANQAGSAYFKVPDGKKYKYFRIVVISRVNDGDHPNGNYYFHASEIRLYHGAEDPKASLITSVPKNLVEALKSEIAKSKAMVDAGNATDEQIAAMQKAYDEFMKQFPDPAKITSALTEAKALETAAEERDGELGFYATGAKEAYKAVIDAVQAQLDGILAQGQPSVAQIDDMLAKLNAATETFNGKLKMPEAGILRIKSLSSDATNNGRFVYAPNSSRKSNLYNGGLVKAEGATTYSYDSNFDGQLNSYWNAEKTDKGYSFKNIYTGLYMAPVKNSDVMSQSDEPYYFQVVSAKYPGAFNLVIAKEDASGNNVYLNAQPRTFALVLWNTANKNDNSAFTFVAGEPESLDAGFLHDLEAKTAPQIITLPIEVKAYGEDVNKFYVVAGQNSTTQDIELAKAPEVLKAGVPYIYIPGDNNTEVSVRLYPTATSVAELKPLTQVTVQEDALFKGLVGVFENTKVGKDYGVFSTDRKKVLLGEGNDNVKANTGFFGVLPAVTAKGVVSLPTNGIITAITGAVISNTGAKAAGIYTISGQRLSSTKNLPAGVYVINGKKAVVK